jgi:tripartite-type tricarboxylate transporter receptor subunit TctC
MTTTRRDILRGGAALGAASLFPMPAIGQGAFPNRSIRIVVPFPAGATTDMLARLYAQHFSERLGQNAVVENVGGGGGSIGAEQVARATPDGHTLLFHNLTFPTTTTVMQAAGRARHDIEKDFEPVSVGAYVPFWYLASADVPSKDLKEFVEFARKADKPVLYGSTGGGSFMNLMGEVLKRDTGIKMDHVPFRGAAPLITDMLAARIQFGGDQSSSSLQHVRSGKIKALAAATKMSSMPHVPTVRELGFPNLEYQGWNGFLAPKGTPEAVLVRLQAECAACAKREDMAKRMTDVGAEPSGSSREEMRGVLRRQLAQMKPVVEELKLVME